MKNPECRATARLLVLDENDHLVLTKRKLDAKQRAGQWDIPGGEVEPGELYLDAAVRECQEELTITINSELVQPSPVHSEYNFDTRTDEWFARYYFLFTGRLAVAQVMMLTEADARTHAPLDHARELVSFIPHQRAIDQLGAQTRASPLTVA